MPGQEVGGDYYGFLPKKMKSGEKALMITVADAAGRGLSSSLYAHAARALFAPMGHSLTMSVKF